MNAIAHAQWRKISDSDESMYDRVSFTSLVAMTDVSV